MKFRFQGREKLLTLGTYPQRSLKEAREACANAKKQLGGGIDPSVQKKVVARVRENTFEAIAREWHENKKSAWTKGYAKNVLERIAGNIFPYLGNRPINEITPLSPPCGAWALKKMKCAPMASAQWQAPS